MAFTLNQFKAALNNEEIKTDKNVVSRAFDGTKNAARKSASAVSSVLPVTNRRFNEEMQESYKRDVINTFLVSDLIEQLQDLGIDVSADNLENLEKRAELFLNNRKEVKPKKQEKPGVKTVAHYYDDQEEPKKDAELVEANIKTQEAKDKVLEAQEAVLKAQEEMIEELQSQLAAKETSTKAPTKRKDNPLRESRKKKQSEQQEEPTPKETAKKEEPADKPAPAAKKKTGRRRRLEFQEPIAE